MSLASNPAGTRYSVAPFRGKPTLMIDGQPSPHYLYCYPLSLDHAGADEIHKRFAEHGCRFFTINVRGGVHGDWSTTDFWPDDNVFPDLRRTETGARNNLVRQAEMIFRHAPDARLWIRYHCPPPLGFRKNHPHEMLLNSFGRRYDEPSLASDLFITQVRQFVANIVRFVEDQAWAERVVGYIVYPLGEGATVLTCEGFLFDQSPVMQQRFAQFVQARYHSDEALRHAWKRDDISLQSVRVPRDQDFIDAGKTHHDEVALDHTAVDKHSPHRLHFPEDHEMAIAADYCRCMRELTIRYLQALLDPVKELAPHKLTAIDAFKQTMLGWPLVARWTGDYQTHMGSQHPVTGAFGVADMLDWPQLDAVATPHDYLHRGMGFGYEPEAIGDSVVLHGKLMLVEEDQRTFCQNDAGRWNPLQRGPETAAGLWRNLGASISRGYSTYPMDIERPSFFMDESVQRVLAARKFVHEAATFWERHDVPGICVLLDDWSTLCEDLTLGYQYLSVLHQRLYGLSRCGVPVRQYLFDDLARDDFPTHHRVFLLPNLFHVDHARVELIRRKLQRDGNVLIWGPATAIHSETGTDARWACELTGIPLKLHKRESPRFVTIDRFDHPITAELPTRVDFGDTMPLGPILWPTPDPQVHRLGGIQWPHAFDGAGLVIRKFGAGVRETAQPTRGAGDWESIFTAAVPLPEMLLRAIARHSGTHIYHETDDVLYADNCTLTIHALRPGQRCVKLPSASTVWDLVTQENLGSNQREIRFTVTEPVTRLFYLGDRDPFTK